MMTFFKNTLLIPAAISVLFGTGSAFAIAPGTATGNVKLRSGPSVGHNAVITIPRGAAFMVDGCLDTKSWCKVRYQGVNGWASSKFIAVSQPNKVSAYQAAIKAQPTNVTMIPNTGERIGVQAVSTVIVTETPKGYNADMVIETPAGITMVRPLTVVQNGVITQQGAQPVKVRYLPSAKITPIKTYQRNIENITVNDGREPGFVEISGKGSNPAIRYRAIKH